MIDKQEVSALITDIAYEHAPYVLQTGHAPSGHNGPYFDPETPVRNTAHWAVTFAYCYKETQDKIFLDALVTCGTYLKSKEACPMGATFHCRTNPKKDFSNGTIGQAWVIEGLCAVYEGTQDASYLQLAEDTFLKHPFDKQRKLWNIVNVDGSYRSPDMTFNHQLWLAASGAILVSLKTNETITAQISEFFDSLSDRPRTHATGLIRHDIISAVSTKEHLRNAYNFVMKFARSIRNKGGMTYKENGYHLFNIFAFALIKKYYGDVEFFGDDGFAAALEYSFSDDLVRWLAESRIELDGNSMNGVDEHTNNIYGYGYNAPGFELPFVSDVFNLSTKPHLDRCEELFRNQLELTYNERGRRFDRNTHDANTLTARIYEATRWLN